MGRTTQDDTPIPALIRAGWSYAVIGNLVGVDPSTVRRWHDNNNIDPHTLAQLYAFTTALDKKPELAADVPLLLATFGLIHTLHKLYGAALETVDSA